MPTDHGPDANDLPGEHSFATARPNPYAARLAEGVKLAYVGPDGQTAEHVVPTRPEADPESLTGVVDDTLFYIYNPREDVLLVRLTASLSEPVTARCDAPGYQLLVSDESGLVVGLIVFGYLRRYDFLAPLLGRRTGAEVDRDLIRRGLEPLRALLPAA